MKKMFLALAMVMMLAAPAQASHAGHHIFVTINGLVCDFCAISMKKVFGKRAEVHDVDVNLTTKIVTLGLNKGKEISDEDIKKGITDAGYTVVGIKRD